jgi:ADP-ribosyl-[dinitrogen reductase] hydrolase
MNKGGNMNFKEKIVNALYAQAVCDAVGNKFEFETDINPVHVIDYANSTDHLVISDDTQMALFGFEAIKNLDFFRGDDVTIEECVEKSFTKSYLDWYKTQTQNPVNHRLYNYSDTLLSFLSMWGVEAPGNTCLSALSTIKSGGIVNNNSKGCGSVMRLLPLVALRGKYSSDTCTYLAQITGDITHKHKENATAIEHYMNIMEVIDCGLTFYSEFDKVAHISDIGEGWMAQECVDMSEWAYTKADSFDDLLRLSIAHDGDSDSVAAVAGTMWGLSGREVPKKYIEKLDALDAIKYIISKL